MNQAAYNMDYDGVYALIWHDKEPALRRWFECHKQSRYDYGPQDHEWLTIEEEFRFTPRGKRIVSYVGSIGSDGPEPAREIRFEPGCPPPPTFYIPPKISYGTDLRQEAEALQRWKAREERRRLEPAPKVAPPNAVPTPSTVSIEDSAPKVPPLRRNV